MDKPDVSFDRYKNLFKTDDIDTNKGVFANLAALAEKLSIIRPANIDTMLDIIINKSGKSPFPINKTSSKAEAERLLPYVWLVGMVKAGDYYLSLPWDSKIDKTGVITNFIKSIIKLYSGWGYVGSHDWEMQAKHGMMHSIIVGLNILKPWIGDITTQEIENAVVKESLEYNHSSYEDNNQETQEKIKNLEERGLLIKKEQHYGESRVTYLFKNAEEARGIFKKVRAFYTPKYQQQIGQAFQGLLLKSKSHTLSNPRDFFWFSMIFYVDGYIKNKDSFDKYYYLHHIQATLFEKVINKINPGDVLYLLGLASILNRYNTFNNVFSTDDFFSSLAANDPRRNQESGWKIHVAAGRHNQKEVAKIAVPYLLRNNIPHKIMTKPGCVEEWIDEQHYQRGKFITTYLYDYETAKKVATELDELLKPLTQTHPMQANEIPPGDAAIGDSGFLFIRYGGYTSYNMEYLSNEGIKSVAYDSRHFPFPKFIFSAQHERMKRRIIGSDVEPFPNLNMRWRFPGTTYDVKWSDFKGQSWQNVFDIFTNHQEYIADQEKFNAVKELIKIAISAPK